MSDQGESSSLAELIGQKVVIDWRIDASNGLHADARLRDTGPLTAEAIRGGRPFGGV